MIAVISLIVVLLDQLSKYIVISTIALNQSIPITSFFSITYITNTGASFGSLQGLNALFIIISILFIGFIIYFLQTFETKILPALALVIGGAIGNLIDRIVYGHVIDFLHIKFWPVFNIADSAITIAAIIIIIQIFIFPSKE